MSLFGDIFMAKLIKRTKRAAEVGPEEREMRLSAVTASLLVRLANSVELDPSDQQMAAMLAVHLIEDLKLDFQDYED